MDADWVPAGLVSPQRLGAPLGVVGDDGVGGVEDRRGGAVVLLELDDSGVGEVRLEAEDVSDVGLAEAVDGLVDVADGGEVALGPTSCLSSWYWARLVSWYSSTRT